MNFQSYTLEAKTEDDVNWHCRKMAIPMYYKLRFFRTFLIGYSTRKMKIVSLCQILEVTRFHLKGDDAFSLYFDKLLPLA